MPFSNPMDYDIYEYGVNSTMKDDGTWEHEVFSEHGRESMIVRGSDVMLRLIDLMRISTHGYQETCKDTLSDSLPVQTSQNTPAKSITTASAAL